MWLKRYGGGPGPLGHFEDEPWIRWEGLRCVSTKVRGRRWGWGGVQGPPAHILGSENTKHRVLEVNWMVIRGYLPL